MAAVDEERPLIEDDDALVVQVLPLSLSLLSVCVCVCVRFVLFFSQSMACGVFVSLYFL